MFIEYQFNGFNLDLASELRNLRNNGNENENVIVGYIQPSKKLWFRHLHDWCQIFMKNPPVFLMIDVEHQINYLWGDCETFWKFCFLNFRDRPLPRHRPRGKVLKKMKENLKKIGRHAEADYKYHLSNLMVMVPAFQT